MKFPSLSCFPCTSRAFSDEDPDQFEVNRKIEEEIQREKHIFKATHRLLLLGAGESGKSTIVKQMHILHINGFTEAERRDKVRHIRENLIDGIQTILNSMAKLNPPVNLGDPANQAAFDYVISFSMFKETVFPQELYEYVITCWADKGVQAAFERSNEYQLFDSAEYFISKSEIIRQDNYLPSEQDILRCRAMTTGIKEAKFEIDKVHFQMVDVGGQRSERKMWIQCFNDVTAIVFVCSSSSYNLALAENPSEKRLKESLALFQSVWTNRFLSNKSVILFLNKQDLLAEKIRAGRHRLEAYFPEFDQFPLPAYANYDSYDDLEVVRAKYFIREKFLQITVGDGERQCYPHFTCAVETENIRRVFNDCRDIVIRIQLNKYKVL
uniref:Guanine nucleotide-binding protein G(s) subunit alpha n=1 Tax=Panagrellus redivivus TaxID=6233 RepID=A0A7E4WC98_PANRE